MGAITEKEAVEQIADGTLKVRFELELTSDVLLSRQGRRGEPKQVLYRLEKGRRVQVVGRHPDPNCRYPFNCWVEGWNEFFALGRQHIPHMIAVTEDGSEMEVERDAVFK